MRKNGILGQQLRPGHPGSLEIPLCISKNPPSKAVKGVGSSVKGVFFKVPAP